MKRVILLSLLIAIAGFLPAQSLTLHDTVQFPFIVNSLGDVGSSDCWGWTDSLGNDYAIMGNSDHVAFVRASDGAVLDTIQVSKQGDGYYHRDFKNYGSYCYAVSEMSGKREGLVVIDMKYLPDSVHFVGAFDASQTFVKSHNLSIDVNEGFLYAEADEFLGNNGVEIFDLADPEAPVKVGFLSVNNTHDIVARNDTVWVAEGYTKAFSVYDLSDKNNPVVIGRVTDPAFGYCHQIWPSDDGNFFYTTEETSNKTIKIWDATDMNNITKRGEILGANDLAHNTHTMGDLLVTSHYTAGVTIVDVSDPDVPVEIARYDTYPQNDIDDFYGCWGAFPYTENGYIYASNFEGTLFILDWDINLVGTEAPSDLSDGKCWPNPVTNYSNIPLRLSASMQVDVVILDIQGRVLDNVFSGQLDEGNFTLPWHPRATLANGTYFVRITAGDQARTEKLILQR